MTDNKNQAIQTSVANALLISITLILPFSVVIYWLVDETERAIRASFGVLILLPLCLVIWRRLRQGHTQESMRALCLLVWLSLTLQMLSAGTVINPTLPLLLALSMTGALAQDKLLVWLMPLLSLASVIGTVILERNHLLTLNTPGTATGLVMGWLIGLIGLVLLAHLAGRHLTRLNSQLLTSNVELQQLSGQLQLAISAGRICCFTLIPTRLSILTSGEASSLLQCPAGEQPIHSLSAISPEDQQRILLACTQAIANKPFSNLDLQLIQGPGANRWYRLFATTAKTNSAQLICALQDIDEEKQTDLAKENFTAMVSHELRTPLTALLGALSLLRGLHGQEMSAGANQLLEMAHRGGERLARLVNEILDFFKLQAGRMPMNCQMAPLLPEIELAVDSVSALLQERQLTLEYEGLSQDMPTWHDSSRTQQVLINLLSNAIKFSPPGSRLWLQLDLDANHARISLRDSGPGIVEEFQARIFEPFSQANMSNTRDDNSTGLGLAFSRQLMQQMGGELSFSSPPGEGATFHVDFLRQPAVTPLIHPASEDVATH